MTGDSFLHLRLIAVFIVAGLFTLGCRSGSNVDIKESKQERNGVTVTAKPYLSEDETDEEFDDSPVELGFLPIRIDVQNDSAETLVFGQSGVALARPDAQQMPAVRIEPRYKSGAAPSGPARIIGAVVPGNTNRKIEGNAAEWNNKGLPALLDVPPELTETKFVYFDFRDDEGKPQPIPPEVCTLLINISRDGGEEWETFRLPIDLTALSE